MNICSSINKLRDLEYMLQNLKLNVYFIGLSETWATTMNQDILNIKCYNHEQCLRNNKKKGGGTSLYIHDSIHYRPRPDLSLPKKIFESIFIEIDKSIFKTNHNTIIGEIYRPPSSKIKTFNSEIEKLLHKINQENKFAFLMGDYNVNTLTERNKTTQLTQEFSSIFSLYYCHKLINLPTREKNNSSTLIDNIYTNIPDCYSTCNSGVLKFLTQSDHYPIFTMRKGSEQPSKKTHIIKRNHNEQNKAMFRKRLKNTNWNYNLNSNTINFSFTSFITKIISDYETCFPKQTTRINYRNRNPWINQALKNEIKMRDNLFMKSRKHPTI